MVYYYYIRVSFLKGNDYIIKSYLVSYCNLKSFFDFLSKKTSSEVLYICAYQRGNPLHSRLNCDRRFI